MSKLVEFPSGLSGNVRGLKGKEFGILTDQKAMRTGAAADRILDTCWESTESKGPYAMHGDRPNWGEILVADRTVALLYSRIATFGNEDELDLKCISEGCKKKFVWTLPLDQLPIVPLPKTSREVIAQGKNKFEAKLPSGAKIWFKLLTGADAKRSRKAVQESTEEELFGTAFANRIIAVEGVEGKDIEKWLDEMSGEDLQELIYVLDEHDGGVETTIDVYCPNKMCGFEWELELPLDIGRLFTPKKSRRRGRVRAGAQ